MELRIGAVGMSSLAVEQSNWIGIGLQIGSLGIEGSGIGLHGIGGLEIGFVDLQVVDNTSNCHSLQMILTKCDKGMVGYQKRRMSILGVRLWLPGAKFDKLDGYQVQAALLQG